MCTCACVHVRAHVCVRVCVHVCVCVRVCARNVNEMHLCESMMVSGMGMRLVDSLLVVWE